MLIYLIILFGLQFFSYIYISDKFSSFLKIKSSKHGTFLLAFLIPGLMVSQMLMYQPGSNISPWAYKNGLLNHILFAGRTLSNWFSIFTALYCFLFLGIGLYKKAFKIYDFLIFFSLFTVVCIGTLKSNSLSSGLAEGLKYLLPFIVYATIKTYKSSTWRLLIEKLLLFTNIILILQVLICKIFTGKYAASSYYLEMREEFFGFYNHPHNFTGLLGILSIWCFYNINRQHKPALNLILVFINIILMFISGSRSYLCSLMIALFYILIFSLIDKKVKRMRKFVFAAIFIGIFLGPYYLTYLNSQRLLTSFLSGREKRWLQDFHYYLENMSIIDKLIGGGFGFVNEVNMELVGTNINSLNIIIDILINNGIIGLLFTILVYFILFDYFIKTGDKRFSIMMMVFFIVSSIFTNLISYQVVTIYMVLVLFVMRKNTIIKIKK